MNDPLGNLFELTARLCTEAEKSGVSDKLVAAVRRAIIVANNNVIPELLEPANQTGKKKHGK